MSVADDREARAAHQQECDREQRGGDAVLRTKMDEELEWPAERGHPRGEGRDATQASLTASMASRADHGTRASPQIHGEIESIGEDSGSAAYARPPYTHVQPTHTFQAAR